MIVVFNPGLSTSRRAVERRVARVLARSGEHLHKCSPRSKSHGFLGDYYLTYHRKFFVTATHQVLEDLARDHGVLGEHETISGE